LQTVFLIVLIAILVAAALLGGLLLVPVKYVFSGGCRGTSLFGGLKIRAFGILWLGGFFQHGKWKLSIGGFKAAISFDLPRRKKEKEEEKEKEEKEDRETKRAALLKYLQHFADRQFASEAWGLIKKLIRLAKPHSIRVEGKAGFYEPHLTGLLAAVLYTVESACRKSCSNLELIWDEEYCDIELELEGKTLLAIVFFHLLRFLLKKKTRQVWKKIRREKKAARAATG